MSSAHSGVQGSKYESDAETGDGVTSKRDSRGLLGAMRASSVGRGKKKKLIKKQRDDRDAVNESRESAGSFSELVLEQYDKMNLDPKLGYHNDSDSEAGGPPEDLDDQGAQYRAPVVRARAPAQGDPAQMEQPQQRHLPKRFQYAYTYQPADERRQNLEELEDDLYREPSQNTEPIIFNRARS